MLLAPLFLCLMDDDNTAFIAFYIPQAIAEQLAIANGEPANELHITLAYVEEIEDIDGLKNSLARWAKTQVPVTVNVEGIGRFTSTHKENEDAVILLCSGRFLHSLRQELIWNIPDFTEKRGYLPHITLAYIPKDADLPLQTIAPVEAMPLSTIALVINDTERFDYELTGEPVEVEVVSSVLKAGARNNRMDLQDIQLIHDKALALGAECMSAKAVMTEGNDTTGGYTVPPDGKATPDKYSHINFSPPQGVIDAAKQGLKLHEDGQTGDGLEAATVAWATKISNGEDISPDKAEQGYKWWQRNARFLDEDKDSPAYASAMLWFGKPGQAWFNKLWEQMQAADTQKAVTPFQDLPLADRKLAWDESAAEGRVRAWAGGPDKEGIDWDKYRQAFMYYNPDEKENFTLGYKLQYADIIDGTLTAIPRAIFAIAGGRGVSAADIPQADKDKVIVQVNRYYEKMAKQFEDDSLVSPFEKAQKAMEHYQLYIESKPESNVLKAVAVNDNEFRAANYIVLWGGPDKPLTKNGRDLEGLASSHKNLDGSIGEYFTPETDFESEYTKSVGRLPLDWEHRRIREQRGGPQPEDVLGYVDWETVKADENGLWVERVLNRRKAYMKYLEMLIEDEKIGSSSEPVQDLKVKASDGRWIKWPILCDTLTVMPMEPRMMTSNHIQALKSLGFDISKNEQKFVQIRAKARQQQVEILKTIYHQEGTI